MRAREAVGFLTGFTAGSRIAGYRLEEQIGRGGMAVVFRAQDEQLNRQVALKVLAPALAADEDFRHRFIRESRSAAAVDDPHIIPVFEAGEADEVYGHAMRYVPGGDVRTLLRRLGPLPTARAAWIISAVASALDAAHGAGLVHRDVKPANMLVDVRPGRPDHVYLTDFGLTKGAVSSASVTRAVRGYAGLLRTRADPSAAGRCAHGRVRTGLRGVHADVRHAAISSQRRHGRPVCATVGPAAAALIATARPSPGRGRGPAARAMAKAPSDRYASCGEFADALRMAFGLRRYDSDLAVALHQESLTDHQHRLGLDHADKLAANASVEAAHQEARRSDEAVTRRRH